MRARAQENAEFQAMFDNYSIMSGKLRLPPKYIGNLPSVPIGGATAYFDGGDSRQKTTGTRVAAGAIIAGPVGAIVGGMLKKEKGKVYATVILDSGDSVIIEGKKKDESKLRAFVAKINKAGAWYADHEFGEWHK